MQSAEIKRLIKKSGIYQWQIAKELGITEFTFSRKLRDDVTEEFAKEIIKSIKNVKGEE